MKFPHVPHRRDGDNQLMRETDDILLIFHCLDEHKLLDKLPRYVSDGPDNMPSARLYEGELNTVMRILDSLKKKMAEQGAVLLKVSRDVQEIQVRYVSLSLLPAVWHRSLLITLACCPAPGLVSFRFLTKLLAGFPTGGRLCQQDKIATIGR